MSRGGMLELLDFSWMVEVHDSDPVMKSSCSVCLRYGSTVNDWLSAESLQGQRRFSVFRRYLTTLLMHLGGDATS